MQESEALLHEKIAKLEEKCHVWSEYLEKRRLEVKDFSNEKFTDSQRSLDDYLTKMRATLETLLKIQEDMTQTNFKSTAEINTLCTNVLDTVSIANVTRVKVIPKSEHLSRRTCRPFGCYPELLYFAENTLWPGRRCFDVHCQEDLIANDFELESAYQDVSAESNILTLSATVVSAPTKSKKRARSPDSSNSAKKQKSVSRDWEEEEKVFFQEGYRRFKNSRFINKNIAEYITEHMADLSKTRSAESVREFRRGKAGTLLLQEAQEDFDRKRQAERSIALEEKKTAHISSVSEGIKQTVLTGLSKLGQVLDLYADAKRVAGHLCLEAKEVD